MWTSSDISLIIHVHEMRNDNNLSTLGKIVPPSRAVNAKERKTMYSTVNVFN